MARALRTRWGSSRRRQKLGAGEVISFYSSAHALHAPATEFFRGERVPCFESPARAQFVHTALVAAGTRSAFCATRPPGHDAGVAFMGGYCSLNNAAVAAQAFRSQGCERVAILDVDYHHGDGTQAIYYSRADVLFASLHGDPHTEYPFYLGLADEIGTGAGLGFNLNLPLPPGTQASTGFAALDTACERIVAYGADALVVSLGLDIFEGDPISHFKLQSDDFLRVGKRIVRLTLPTVFMLEGGYASAELGVNAVNVIEGFEQA